MPLLLILLLSVGMLYQEEDPGGNLDGHLDGDCTKPENPIVLVASA